MKRVLIVALLVLFAASVPAEVGWKVLSVTDVSQTFPLPVPSAGIAICNAGANPAYFRLFWEMEIPAAATTAYTLLPAGSAAAPFCISFSKSPTNPANFSALSIIAGGGLTATVNVSFQ